MKKNLAWFVRSRDRRRARELGSTGRRSRNEQRLRRATCPSTRRRRDDEEELTPPPCTCRRATPTLQSRLRTKVGRRLDRAPEHALEKLDERSRSILKRRWRRRQGHPARAGDEYGISAERVRQWSSNAINKLKGCMRRLIEPPLAVTLRPMRTAAQWLDDYGTPPQPDQ